MQLVSTSVGQHVEFLGIARAGTRIHQRFDARDSRPVVDSASLNHARRGASAFPQILTPMRGSSFNLAPA